MFYIFCLGINKISQRTCVFLSLFKERSLKLSVMINMTWPKSNYTLQHVISACLFVMPTFSYISTCLIFLLLNLRALLKVLTQTISLSDKNSYLSNSLIELLALLISHTLKFWLGWFYCNYCNDQKKCVTYV